MATAFEWIEGRRHTADANVIGREVEKLAKRGGGYCSPAAYVDAARPEGSALHDTLEWDDEVAAEAHRRWQARTVIKSLHVVGADDDLPAFVSVRIDAAVGYVRTDTLAEKPDLHAYAVGDVLARLSQLRRRHAALKELSEVWAAVERLEAAA